MGRDSYWMFRYFKRNFSLATLYWGRGISDYFISTVLHFEGHTWFKQFGISCWYYSAPTSKENHKLSYKPLLQAGPLLKQRGSKPYIIANNLNLHLTSFQFWKAIGMTANFKKPGGQLEVLNISCLKSFTKPNRFRDNTLIPAILRPYSYLLPQPALSTCCLRYAKLWQPSRCAMALPH